MRPPTLFVSLALVLPLVVNAQPKGPQQATSEAAKGSGVVVKPGTLKSQSYIWCNAPQVHQSYHSPQVNSTARSLPVDDRVGWNYMGYVHCDANVHASLTRRREGVDFFETTLEIADTLAGRCANAGGGGRGGAAPIWETEVELPRIPFFLFFSRKWNVTFSGTYTENQAYKWDANTPDVSFGLAASDPCVATWASVTGSSQGVFSAKPDGKLTSVVLRGQSHGRYRLQVQCGGSSGGCVGGPLGDGQGTTHLLLTFNAKRDG